MVKNWISSNYEKIVYISPDGERYNLHDPYKKSVISMAGWGLPPAEIAATRGPFQHGTNPLTIRIPVREITVNIRHNGCDRDEYWANRAGLVNALRLNRTSINNPSPGKLKWYRADGTIRQLDVLVTQGPRFDPRGNGWDEFSYQDEISFIAHNPIIYDPTQHTDVFTDLGCVIIQQLVFPFTFNTSNILFGVDVCNATNTRTINYEGNWQEFPLITVVGPANDFKITHAQTSLFIWLKNYTIDAGESVTFDLRYGRKTVINNSGQSLLGFISSDSDLGSFAIEPDPVVSGGVNSFEVSIDNGTADTQVVFQYYNRYIG